MSEAPKKSIRSMMRPSYIKCWQMFIHILNRWSVIVPFQVHEGATGFIKAASNKDKTRENSEMRMDMVYFFVPSDCTNKFEVVRFLDRELDADRRPASEGLTLEDGTYTPPGMEAHVYPMVFEADVLDPYVTAAQRHLMQTEMFKQLAAEHERKGEKTIGGEIFKAMVEATKHAKDSNPELYERSEDDDAHAAYGMNGDDIMRLDQEAEDEEDGEKR